MRRHSIKLLLILLVVSFVFSACGSPQYSLKPEFEEFITSEQATDLYDYFENCRKESTQIDSGKQNNYSEEIQTYYPDILQQLSKTPVNSLSELELECMLKLSYFQLALSDGYTVDSSWEVLLYQNMTSKLAPYPSMITEKDIDEIEDYFFSDV